MRDYKAPGLKQNKYPKDQNLVSIAEELTGQKKEVNQSAKEKADSLFFEMARNQVWHRNDTSVEDQRQRAIKCALFAVDEILEIADAGKVRVGRNGLSDFEFWQEVKIELQKL